MYNIPYYKADDDRQVLEFMQKNSFVILTGCDAENKPVATHVPVLVEEREGKVFLVGHVKRQADHHKAFVQNANVLVIFTGPHAYVSASWYNNQKQASTWNYLTVHAKGALRFLDEEALVNVLKRTTAHFENNPDSPSLVEHLDPAYVERLMKAIVAFEIEVKDIDHVFKLSQNRDEESYRSIVSQLQKGDNEAKQVAEMMQQRKQ
ncbi:MAG: FMN-binding negative transcriptional regulator [Segetibacter sp.]|jgi:transcriptional regulator|nr:FMN-binding negative transcriptional regulator [Segetibacter sp.]